MKTRKELMIKEFGDLKLGRKMTNFARCLLIAMIITLVFFNGNVFVCFILANISWIIFSAGIYGRTKAEERLRFLNKFDNDTEFPDEFM